MINPTLSCSCVCFILTDNCLRPCVNQLWQDDEDIAVKLLQCHFHNHHYLSYFQFWLLTFVEIEQLTSCDFFFFLLTLKFIVNLIYQVYEFGRLHPYSCLQALRHQVQERCQLSGTSCSAAVDTWLPHLYITTDGVVSLLPGESLYF